MVKLAEHLLCFFGIKRSLVMPDNNFELKTCIAEVADLLVDFEVKFAIFHKILGYTALDCFHSSQIICLILTCNSRFG